MHDSLDSRLTMDDLLHTARIADITGFTPPPVVLAQLRNLVQSSGPEPAKATAEPLLSAYGCDLAALLDMFQAMDITPSITWMDHATPPYMRMTQHPPYETAATRWPSSSWPSQQDVARVVGPGARLPPAVIQGELRALEAAVIRKTINGGSGSRGGSRGGLKNPTRNLGNDASTAAAVAALNAAFSLPSASGSDGLGEPSSSPTTSLPSSTASSIASSSGSLSLPATTIPPFPPPFGGSATTSPPPLPSRLNGDRRRISPYGAYLALWAFHHYRYIPHATIARVVGPALLAAVLDAGVGGGRGLGPRQRCRIVRSILMCFGSVPPHLLARYDWSSLFRGWETLGAAELLPLLQDVAALARRQRRRQRGNGLAPDAAMADGGSNGGGRSQLLRLSHLVAHVVQLPGWQRRLENVSLSDAIASLAGLLTVLSSDAADADEGVDAAAKETELDTAAAAELGHVDIDGGDGGGGSVDGDGVRSLEDGGDDVSDLSRKAILASPFAQGVLASWLGLVLPTIQLQGSQPRHGTHGVDGDTAAGGVTDAELSRPTGYVAVAAAGAEINSGGGGADRRSMSWLPPPMPAAATALTPTLPPPLLTARELTAALTVLRDTATALDPREQPVFHRTLMWAMQRLGSRAGRCTLEPETFSSVPDMLVRVDALGWVDVPIVWAHAVVQHPDAEGLWFRNLPWHGALRAVLVSGKLVIRARAEVLRQHGANAAAATAAITEFISPQSEERPHLQQPAVSGGPSARVPSSDRRTDATEPQPQPPPSKATALLAAAQRLRSHLVGLLAARTASCSGSELRQLALTWQVYGMPYDQDALAVTLRALTAAAAAAAGGCIGVDAARVTANAAAVSRESILDAASRLEMMCEAHQVPRDEVEHLFGPLRAYGL
ncbi:hypothetical protein VOLCADRAFT_90033 [Volvox carteri f. nagariensis]|uniref:Uncharacterized protein n=1 Tax=Volvox carteri f. nagariensis TaxID=3068 RepID=D8TTB4_VOLCA|nr:uncharacterized protein VOLCADRAFT_90033 [Volvox carteri f. nagariensis]EFJ49170.1 hypothetical protein VOLCADRAFT_90033 [Volvox carteri f. nagariensis]|eukprot:XP_002949618.1 hypothetical protein VOLCADRAFT_90033 [Volvox carteri f. nagariensis]